MPVHSKELIDALAIICEEKNLQVTVTECLKAGILAGGTTAVAGLLLGPIGFALGAAIGGVVSSLSSQNKFKSVATVIMEMPAVKKKQLCNKVVNAFKDVGVTDVVALAMIIQSESTFKELAIREVTKFLTGEMSLSIRQ